MAAMEATADTVDTEMAMEVNMEVDMEASDQV